MTDMVALPNEPQTEIEAEFDLPELADTMEEADARVSASTLLYVLGKIQGEYDANDAEHKTLQVFQAARHGDRQAQLDAKIDWLTGKLEDLFGMMDPGKKKSLNLLGGQLGHRKQTDELVVEDDQKVMDWAAEFATEEGVVRVKFELDRKHLRQYITQEIVQPNAAPPAPGVSLVERPPLFFAKPQRIK